MNNERLSLASLVVIFALAFWFYGDGPPDSESRRPDPPRRPQVAAVPSKPSSNSPALPPARPGDPGVLVELGAKHDSSGTAFSIGQGVWMTARHVVDGCAQLGILTGPRTATRAFDIRVHPNADLATFRSKVSTGPFGFETGPLRRGQEAFHFGYPKGKPGAVRSELMGRTTLKIRGRYNTREPVLVWVERDRVPASSGPLSGISGGPVVDRDGEVVGVHVAGSKRRGRNFTSAPSSIRDLVSATGLDFTAGRSALREILASENYVEIGRQLRKELRVAKVICDVA